MNTKRQTPDSIFPDSVYKLSVISSIQDANISRRSKICINTSVLIIITKKIWISKQKRKLPRLRSMKILINE